MSTAPFIRVEVDLPSDGVGDTDPSTLGAELRALWAIEKVRRGRCGVGKGAELAAMPRAAFMRLLGEHGVPVIDYDLDDLANELATLDAL